MHVFLTGATGYIGSAVAEALQKDGHRVTGCARSRIRLSNSSRAESVLASVIYLDLRPLSKGHGQLKLSYTLPVRTTSMPGGRTRW